jgi:hypothetical protein
MGQGVGVVEVRSRLRVGDDSARSDARRRLVDGVRREGCGIHGGHPEAHLVQLVKVVDQVFEVDVMVGVVIEDQLLPVPGR